MGVLHAREDGTLGQVEETIPQKVLQTEHGVEEVDHAECGTPTTRDNVHQGVRGCRCFPEYIEGRRLHVITRREVASREAAEVEKQQRAAGEYRPAVVGIDNALEVLE